MLRKPLVNICLQLSRRHRHDGMRRSAAGLSPDVHRRQTSTTSSSDTVMGASKLKTMDDLGGPSFATTLYWLFIKGYFKTTQQMQIEHKSIYGRLWKSKYGPLIVVNVASADLIEQVLRQEGRHPIRTDMPHWRDYRELRNKAHGPPN